MKKISAHSAPKPITKNAPIFGLIAAGILVIILGLQLIGIGKILSGLGAQFDNSDGWAIAVTAIVLLTELAALPFLLRMKLSYGASVFSGVAAVFAPWLWVLVAIWSVGIPDVVATQFGVITAINISWWLIAGNIVWLLFNLYTVRQLNIEKVWYKATGLKPRSELKKKRKK